jgi:hypothetical protein
VRSCGSRACTRSCRVSLRSKKCSAAPTNNEHTVHRRSNGNSGILPLTAHAQGICLRMGRQGPQRQAGARRTSRRRREPGAGRAAPPGRARDQDQEAPHALGQGDQAQGHRDLHPPAGHHDEGRRAAAAVLRHRRPRQCQRSVTKLLNDIRTDVETGTSLSAAFRKYPKYFDNLYCNLVEAGEAAGILEDLLDRLATYMEKTEAIKSRSSRR